MDIAKPMGILRNEPCESEVVICDVVNENVPKETGMGSTTESSFISEIKFFDLLLAQFGGSEGELPSAIAYLTQASNEDHPTRKASLIRIARVKLQHADIVGSILLQISTNRAGPLSTRIDRDEFKKFLNIKGITIDDYDAAPVSLREFSKTKLKRPAGPNFSHNPQKYLAANILTEEHQIVTYQRLVGLTEDSNFISALNYVKARQIEHRDEFIEMLRRLTH